MRMKKSNKKLAIMVGMALSMGVTFGFAPGDAYAADYSLVIMLVVVLGKIVQIRLLLLRR